MSFIKKGSKLYKKRGIVGIIRTLISRFLSRMFILPLRKIAVYNGIAVRGVDLLEKKDVFPEHEAELISAIRNYVKPDEKAILIGGGSGASSVVTAHQVGQKGEVITYEAVKRLYEKILETLKLNQVEKIVKAYHAIIEKPVYLLGKDENATLLPASNLQDCDVLIMDCEGAELPILKNVKIRPYKIIVETHRHFGSSDKDVSDVLSKLGYELVSSQVRSTDIKILVAVLKKNKASN